MIKSILYKEFLKTYKILIPFVLVFAVIIGDTWLDARKALEFNDPTANMVFIVFKQAFSYNYINIAALTFAVVLAVFQFFPEVSQARARLHLHLPLSYRKLVFMFIFYGMGVLVLSLLVVGLGYYMILTYYYPIEIFWAIFSKLLPIFLSSIFLYLTTALVFMEPSIKIKLAYVGLAVLVLRLYYPIGTKLYFASTLLDVYMMGIVAILIYTLYATFATYKRGYIK